MKRHPCSWIRKLKIVEMAILLKLVYRFSAIPIKTPGAVFCRNSPAILKYTHMEVERPKILKTILKNKKVRILTLYHFKIYCNLE